MPRSDVKWPNWMGVVVQHLELQRAARERLIAQRAQPLTGVEGGSDAQGYWCYFHDPEGNVFELSQRLGSAWNRDGQ